MTRGMTRRTDVRSPDRVEQPVALAHLTIDQVREIVAKSNKSLALLIERDGNRIFVPVRMG